MAQAVKNLPAMQATWVQFLGGEDPLEEGMAIHSSILVWRIPMDSGAWRAAIRGVAKSRTWLSDQECMHWWLSGKESGSQCRRYRFDPWIQKIPWRRKWQPTPVLPGTIPWTEESGGLQSMGLPRIWHNKTLITGAGDGTRLQCSCLENPRDGGAWWAAIYGVTQSQTWLKRLSSSSSINTEHNL